MNLAEHHRQVGMIGMAINLAVPGAEIRICPCSLVIFIHYYSAFLLNLFY